MSNKKDDKIARCSFCGKKQSEVKKLIYGNGVYICDECVSICQDMINEEIQSSNLKLLGWIYNRARKCKKSTFCFSV